MFAKILHRPALAIVVSLIILFLGGLGALTLPKAQFPKVSPPRVLIFIKFPGSSAKTLTKAVLVPFETAINGVRYERYMVSTGSSAGEARISIYFQSGTNPGLAVVFVKSRISVVKKRIPPLVQREGILVRNIQASMLMYINLYSTNEHADMKFLFNYARVNILPILKRLEGVGRAKTLGSRQYSMRIWLDLERMRAYHISPDEVMEKLNNQSVIESLGRLGRASHVESQSIEFTLTYEQRFETKEKWGSVIIRSSPEGETLYLRDIADVALGSEYYDIYSNIDGYPSAAILLNQTPSSNAIKTIEEVKKTMEHLKAEMLPPGMKYEYSYDISNFLEAAIDQVLETLYEAFILVSLVVFVFLGDWRSTLIPILAVPVSLIGAFFIMMLCGLSLNMITLFALVLAIGMVVDDAIVVVEAVNAAMEEKGLSPYMAAREVLHELSGAIIAITLVMVSVFVPITFMTGPVGVFYRNFAIVMISSIMLSAVIALTLSPVLCAMILKPHSNKKKRFRGPIALGLGLFNYVFDKVLGGYVAIVRRILPRRILTILIIGGFCVGIYIVNTGLSKGFIPGEDQGMIYAVFQTPAGTTLATTYDKAKQLQKLCEEVEGVESVAAICGYETLTRGRGSNVGTCLVALKEWSERDRTALEVSEELEELCRDNITGCIFEFFQPPPIPGYGTTGGLAFRLLQTTPEPDYHELGNVNEKFMDALKKRPELQGIFTFFNDKYPQLYITLDNQTIMQKGLTIRKVMHTLSIMVASTYEQGMVRFGRFWKLYVQAKPEYRRLPEDLFDLFVKNEYGEMVPFSAFLSFRREMGMNEINRYNLHPSAPIRGRPGEGYSTADAITAIQEVAAEVLPEKGYKLGYENLTFDQVRAGHMALYIFMVVVGFVYLVLVGQYESFMLPLAVITSLPIGVFGSFICLEMAGLDNDVYAQIGLIMLVGLMGKNAILVIEFAVQSQERGASIMDAALEGARVRFRPILMTSFAFIVGLLPLVVASGAGANGNRTIGTTAAGGMFVGTVIGVFMIPGLYYLFAKISEGKSLITKEEDEPLSEEMVDALEQEKELDGPGEKGKRFEYEPNGHEEPSGETSDSNGNGNGNGDKNEAPSGESGDRDHDESSSSTTDHQNRKDE